MGENHADIDRHVRIYMAVFGTLMLFTGLTVAAWKWGPAAVGPTIAVALAIAVIKASLVATRCKLSELSSVALKLADDMIVLRDRLASLTAKLDELGA